MCKPIVISREGDICITHCMNCKIVNIWKKEMLMTFTFEQFNAYVDATKGFKFDDFIETHPDGHEVLVLATPFPDISLTFNRVDWSEFLVALEQAAYMQMVYGIVQP